MYHQITREVGVVGYGHWGSHGLVYCVLELAYIDPYVLLTFLDVGVA